MNLQLVCYPKILNCNFEGLHSILSLPIYVWHELAAQKWEEIHCRHNYLLNFGNT